jgi:hypothetical protein
MRFSILIIIVVVSHLPHGRGFSSLFPRSQLTKTCNIAKGHQQLRALNQDPMRYDMSVTFGSEDPDDFGTEEDDFRAEQASRKAKIDALLKQQDVDFKEERRRKKWGKFANATSKEEIQALEEEERLQIAKGQ